jgi:hypothetical protein
LGRRGWRDFVPYLLPYAGFLVLVSLGAPLALRVALPLALLVFFVARGAFPELGGARWRGAGTLADVLFGVALAVLWVGPYWLWDGLPRPGAGEGFDRAAPFGADHAGVALAVRLVGFAGVTPFVEELFVRSFLLRFLDVFDRDGDFRAVPIGRFAWRSFLFTVVYFGLSHRSWEWAVAFPTGALFNLWLYRRRQLGPVILAHAVTNATIWTAVVLAPPGLTTRSGAVLDPWIFL